MDVVSHGHRIHYVAEGAGEPVVMIPGILMSAARWVDVGYVHRFAQEFRVVAVDPLGHGKSDKPHEASEYDWRLCADHLLAVMDQEGLDDAHIWGYSRGAMLANVLASQHPERVRSLIIGGSFVGALPENVREVAGAGQLKLADTLRGQDWDGFWEVQGIDDQATRDILRASQDELAIVACLEGAVDSMSINVDLSRLRRPPFTYLGDKEATFTFFRQLAAQQGAEFHAIPGRGHAGAFQDIDAVAPIVRDFLLRSQADTSA